jgi:YfiR/HmsC-like
VPQQKKPGAASAAADAINSRLFIRFLFTFSRHFALLHGAGLVSNSRGARICREGEQSLPIRAGILFATLAGNLAGAAETSLPPALATERSVKAAYLFKLPPFVDWPANAFVSPADPFRLCVVGEDPFGAWLDRAGQGQSVGSHPVVIVRLKMVTPDDHCQLMYISGEAQFVSQGLASVDGTPVLTVTEAQSGEKAIVTFATAGNHVHLEIDQDAALRNHLNVSSKLLDITTPEENAP